MSLHKFTLFLGLLTLATFAFASAVSAQVFDCEFSTDGTTFSPLTPHYPGTKAYVYLISSSTPVTIQINTTQTKTSTLGTILPMYRFITTTLVNGYTQFVMNPGEEVGVDFGVGPDQPRAYIVVAAPTISGAASGGTVLPTSLGNDYIISTPGTYYLQGSCTGNINVTASGRVDIIGENQAYLLGQVDSTRDGDGTINGSTSSEVHVRGVTVEIPDGGLFGIFLMGSNCTVQDSAVVSPNTANGVRGRGGIECGMNGNITGCVIAPGDDAIRLCQPNTSVSDCIVHMLGNGSVFQFGYNAKFNGAAHTADRITVFGRVESNGAQQDGQPFQGRMVAGGQAPASGSNISLTNVDLRLAYCNALTNLATGAAGVTIDNITLSGTVNNPDLTLGESKVSSTNPNGIAAFTLLADTTMYPGSYLHEVNINLGRGLPALQGVVPDHVWITGDVTGTINGWNIASDSGTGDTTPPAAPTGLTLIGGNNQVVLIWANNTESDFSCYNVYRSEPAAGIGYQQIAAGVTTTTFTDTTVPNGLGFDYCITAVDTSNNESTPSTALSVLVDPAPPVISTTSLPSDVQNVTYNQTLAAYNSPTSWAVSVGSLPPGLALDMGAGVISGTPTTVGTYDFTVTAGNIIGTSAGQAFSLSITATAIDTAVTVWDGDYNTLWGTSANWVGNQVPDPAHGALFNTAFTRQPKFPVSRLTSGIWLGTGATQGVDFNASSPINLTLYGGTFNAQTNAGFYMNDSANNNLTISNNVTIALGSSIGFYNEESSGILTLSGGLKLSNKTLTIGSGSSSTGAVTIDSTISGIGSIIVNSGGPVTFSGTNTYTGKTTVNAGTLALVGGSQASAITVNSGASLGFTLGSPTSSTGKVTFSSGATVAITGTPTGGTYTLLTSSAKITGTPVLAPPIANYSLVVKVKGGDALQLVPTP